MQFAQVPGMFIRDPPEQNLVECLSVNPHRLGSEILGQARACEIWKTLSRSAGWSASAVEASPPIGGHHIVAFGADVLVSKGFADAELANPRPFLNSRILESIAEGRSVALRREQIRKANSTGGLDAVILYGSWREDLLTPDHVSEVCTLLATRYLQVRLGYRVNRLFMEAVNKEIGVCLAMRAWREVRRFETPDASRSLLVMTREDSFAVPASLSNPLFHFREPVLRLRDADQELLLAALGGATDEELASNLRLTLPAIKKRWVSVFERTVHARPDLFPEVDRSQDDGRRSGQKRHHVLAYMRSHLEELRPRIAT